MMLQEKYDIVIVGAGPAGLMLSTLLARWGYKIKHIDNRPGPTQAGRADAIQPRTLAFLANMDLKRPFMTQKPARVYEAAFWNPSEGGIIRTGTWASCPSFIDARYSFTTLLHQGKIERLFIDDLAKNGVSIQRPWSITDFRTTQDLDFPLEVTLKHVERDECQVIKSKYLFSGEGSRSSIRTSLGIDVQYKDKVTHVWGVMDGRVKTDFPDIKMMCTVHSKHGSILIIPREDGLVRFYIQVTSSNRTSTVEELQATARKVLHPYRVEWETMEWYSVYPIRQGLAERYTLDERVFLGGDACHTHSPKAGQGMNAAFMDSLNLAWKIHHVECGFANRSVLKSYELERRTIAKQLLDFDASYSALMSQGSKNSKSVDLVKVLASAANTNDATSDDEFIRMFKSSREFVSGYGVVYGESIYNWSPSNHPAKSSLFNPPGCKLRPGRIMSFANVTRVTDANIVALEQEIPVNGSFRIFVFAQSYLRSQRALRDFALHLEDRNSFFSHYLRPDIDTVSYFEHTNPHSFFFSMAVIFAACRVEVDIDSWLPPLLTRYRDHVYADDVVDLKRPEVRDAAHAKMGFEREGGVVVVRPDGYIGCTIALTEGSGTVDALNQYFASFGMDAATALNGDVVEAKASNGILQKGALQNGVSHNGLLHNGDLHNGELPKVSLHNGDLQNGIPRSEVFQNGGL